MNQKIKHSKNVRFSPRLTINTFFLICVSKYQGIQCIRSFIGTIIDISKYQFPLNQAVLNYSPTFMWSTLYLVREIIFTSEQFRKFLMEMKNHIRIAVLARYSISPQFLHEKYLIGKLGRGTQKKIITIILSEHSLERHTITISIIPDLFIKKKLETYHMNFSANSHYSHNNM